MTKAEIDVARRMYGVPTSVPYPEPTREEGFGIGACDDQIIDMTDVTEWSENSEAAPWHEAGELYAIALRGADTMRRRAFERGPTYHPDVIYGSGNFATLIEETTKGLPAW